MRKPLMPDGEPDFLGPSQQRQMALSGWDGEGGAGPRSPQEGLISGEVQSEALRLTNTELVQLRIRVIALLAKTSDRQLALAREMAAYISPRPGFTRHRLTIHAAAQMIHFVERAGHFRVKPPS